MPSPQDDNWSKEDEEASIKRGVSKSSSEYIHVNTLNILVTNALLKCRGQPTIQVGLLWIPHSIEAGLFVSNVCALWEGFSFLVVLLETFLLCAALSDRL